MPPTGAVAFPGPPVSGFECSLLPAQRHAAIFRSVQEWRPTPSALPNVQLKSDWMEIAARRRQGITFSPADASMEATALQRWLISRIHKTASTAFASQITEAYGLDRLCPITFEWELSRWDSDRLADYSIFQGHISVSGMRLRFPHIRAVTMLREPRRRILSAYYFWKRIAESHQDSAFFRAIKDMSLLDFLHSRDPLIYSAIYNVQSRLLAGGHFGSCNHTRTNVIGPALPIDELFDMAVNCESRFAFVGSADHYQISLDSALSLMELAPAKDVLITNVNPDGNARYDRNLENADIGEALETLVMVDDLVYRRIVSNLAH